MFRARVDSSAAGFTLIEALVAMAIIGIVLASLASLIAASARGTLLVEAKLHTVADARAVFAALPGRNQLAEGKIWGKLPNGGWQVDTSPYVSPDSQAFDRSAWAPQKVMVTVHSNTGSAIRLTTIRLRHLERQ